MTNLEFLETEKVKAEKEMLESKKQLKAGTGNPLAYSSKRSYYASIVDQIKKAKNETK